MRRAELVMALLMLALSLGLMAKSAELPIWWIRRLGPGAGAFPFWLSAGMAACCVAIIVRWFLRASPPSRSEEPYMDRYSAKVFAVAAGSLTGMIASVHLIGTYGAIPLFFIFYIRFVGRHSWATTLSLAIATPVIAFFFFEIALNITLPKGFTEPLFYPLYDLFL